MSVLMLGHSTCGKTSYMAAMYAEMLIGIGGFSIAAARQGDHDRLNILGNNLKRGVYPTSTDILQEYSFKLLFEGAEVMRFDWHDYRGGALLENSQISPMAADLQQKIGAAEALIVFLDGENIDTEIACSAAQWRLLASLIHQAIAVKSVDSDVFPISFVITKGDRPQLQGIWTESVSEIETRGANNTDRALSLGGLLSSPGLQPIKSIFEMLERHKSVSALLTATSVGSQSYNVYFPFLFSMAYCLKKSVRMARDAWLKASDSAKYHSERDTLGDVFMSWMKNETTHREFAKRYREEADRAWEQKRKLELPLKAIGNLLAEKNGRCCQLTQQIVFEDAFERFSKLLNGVGLLVAGFMGKTAFRKLITASANSTTPSTSDSGGQPGNSGSV